MTQLEAADAAGFSTYQGWQRYETGAAGIFKPAMQERLTAAIGSSAAELAAIRQQLLDGPRPVPGLAEVGPAFAGKPESRRFTVPTVSGEAVLIYPAHLSREAAADLADYLELFTRSLRRQSGQ